MNTRNIRAALGAAVITLGLGTAQANQLAGLPLTGTLTAAPSSDYVKIDGYSYHIPAGSPAAAQARGLTPGQQVDVRLSGAPKSASSEVISIQPHQK